MGKKLSLIILTGAALLAAASCSINRMATRMAADALASPGGTSVFASETDPQLVADALPFALKLYETLLQSDPENRSLLEATAEGFVSYANAFIHTPATMLGYEELDRQKEMLSRAKSMYLRGRDYALRALEVDYPGFTAAVKAGKGRAELQEMDEENVKTLYWAAAGWMGAISAAGFDTAMLMELPRPVALAARGLELDEEYGQGALHGLFIDIYGGVPSEQMLYGSSDLGSYSRELLAGYYVERGVAADTPAAKARYHFDRAVAISEGQLAGPYVSLAASVSVQTQDADEYRRLLETALSIDVDENPRNRLVNIISRRKAQWLLDTIGDRFLLFEE
jgi:predicted anti-sigma-YlaC factor YlaD